MMKFVILVALACLAIAETHPRGKEARVEKEWWKYTVIYQIYPRSFKDSDSTGTGDLKGIESKLDYFTEIGVETVWLSPIYTSPMVDFGYDVANFTDIDPIFGTMDDFKSLANAIHERGMKLVLDIVPNHSSDQCEWFQKSVKKEDPYTDYYIWLPAKGLDAEGNPIPPNNWVSNFGGSMWEWNEERQEFYLHQFAIQQADLNYRNPLVVQEMKNVFQFWLDLGVDGFRVDAIPHLFEDPDFPDETPSGNPDALPNEYAYWNHIHTFNLPEVLDVVGEFRDVLDNHAAETDGVDRVMMTEGYVGIDKIMEYYGNETRRLAHIPFNFDLIGGIQFGFSAQELYDLVDGWMSRMPEWAWPNWLVGNHDNTRVATRFGQSLVDGMNMLVQLMQGTAITYYGEELGMNNTFLTWEQTVDPSGCNAGPDRYQRFSRDPERTPMQWDQSANAGFTDGNETWLPINDNYLTYNVKLESVAVSSHLNVYNALVEARKTPVIQSGNFIYRVVANDNVFAFTRILGTEGGYFIAINPSDNDVVVDATEFLGVPANAEVYTQSIGFKDPTVIIGSTIDTNAIPLGAKDAIVLSFTPISKTVKQ